MGVTDTDTTTTMTTPPNRTDTAVDYANIFEHLNEIWDIEHIGGLSGEAVRGAAVCDMCGGVGCVGWVE